MIYTSCFTSKLLKGLELQLVAVCMSVSKNVNCTRFLGLAPNREMTALAVQGKTIEFEALYKSHILDNLDPIETYSALDGSILLSWENPHVFSHRRLIADWLEKATGNPVLELDEPERAALRTLAALRRRLA